MGTLRTEPKIKSMDEKLYQGYADILRQAQRVALDSHLFYDLEDDERQHIVVKNLLFVAAKEGIGLKVRQPRGQKTVQLFITEQVPRTRIPGKNARQMILDTLHNAGKPLGKRDILSQTGISTSSWNTQIRDLLACRMVERNGELRKATYILL